MHGSQLEFPYFNNYGNMEGHVNSFADFYNCQRMELDAHDKSADECFQRGYKPDDRLARRGIIYPVKNGLERSILPVDLTGKSPEAR